VQDQDDQPQNGGGNGQNGGAVALINAGNGADNGAAGGANLAVGNAPDAGGARFGGFGGFGGGGSRWDLQNDAPVFARNDSDALTYFLIAQRLGHPLAGSYVAAQRSEIRYYYYNDASRLIADAEKRARFWSPPYEYYPGTTLTGDLHSDESLPSFEQRAALARFREIPLPAIVEALDFRGYRMNPRLCGPLPVCLHNASVQFQAAFKWEPTGWLSPIQTVRLIQMAAFDGDAIAQDRLGIMYAKGIGVPQNFVKAEKWFVKSANQRYPDALYNLSVLYRVGPNGIDPDENKSNSYRQMAERAGYIRTRCELLDLMRVADAAGHDRPEGAKR
jgi:TPR repeat protein